MYTNEENIQIVIALLKAHGIKYVVASPGSMNASFVSSIQDDADFVVYSCFDERSAAYMECGIAAEKGEPVVLSCTGATASRNYLPALTEAYYRKLPILAITCLSTRDDIGQMISQQIDRTTPPKDAVVESVYIPIIKDAFDKQVCIREANKAILALRQNGGGPVHIDLCSYLSMTKVPNLPNVRVIHRITREDPQPQITHKRVGIMVGAHKKMSERLVQLIDEFCATYDAIVYSVNPKSYNGRYAVNAALLFSQYNYTGELNKPDLCIHIGEINTDAVGFTLCPKEVWRVNEDGGVKDHYKCLTHVFQMTEEEFFANYAIGGNLDTQLKEFEKEDAQLRSALPELLFSNAWIAQQLAPAISNNAEIYLGILNSLRAWDYANPSKAQTTNANVGGFGIDGCISSMIGASIVSPEKEFYGVFGDLAFFYDMNCLGNRHIGNNLHILVINNDGGQQFRNSDHPCYAIGYDALNEYVAAAGHNGAKSPDLIKNYAENLGFVYITASNKEEFLSQLPNFLKQGKSVVFEVFTKAEAEEEDAFRLLRSILVAPKQASNTIKSAIKNAVGKEKIKALKTLLGV